MKVHEFQAKEILRGYGLPVPRGGLAHGPDEAAALVAQFGGRGVVKAQIYAGGRGKAGGVKVVTSAEETRAAFGQIMGMTLVSPQTGPEGRLVRKVLVEEALDIRSEAYLSLLVDRGSARLTILGSSAGGMEIEEVAARSPEKIIKIGLDPIIGFSPYVARTLAFGLGLEASLHRQLQDLVAKLIKAFRALDASLIEINPLVVTAQGRIVAADAKITFDDNALYRHQDLAGLDDPDEADPLEWQARQAGINYIRLDGNIGAMVNGAGLAMATMDLIKRAGAEPANFLDVGGGASKAMIVQGFKIILSDPRVRAILVNIFGGILRCDVLAEGLVAAAREIGLTIPLIIRLSGTNVELGREILAKSGLAFQVAADMAEAARLVAVQVGGAS
jgi:succinyl-CoA synthetase beta subunit